MSPFKRLNESNGHEPWLDSAAQQVQAGDAWALVSDEQAQRIGAKALAHVRERTRPKSSRTLVIVFAVVASSAALAAAGRYVVSARSAVVAPVRPASGPVLVAPPPAPVVAEPPAAVVAEPAPAATERPAPVRPAAAPRPALAPRAELPPAAPELSPLEAEAQLLLKALHQLRVEHDAAAALATLDEHDVRFPSGAMSEEAAAARREAQALKSERSP